MDYHRVILPMEPPQTQVIVRVATQFVRVQPVSSVITNYLVDRAVHLIWGNLGTRPSLRAGAMALVDEKSLWTKKYVKQQQDAWD
jgi:hypothetical protein